MADSVELPAKRPLPGSYSLVVLAIDPGRAKCGLALVSSPPLAVLHREIVAADRLIDSARVCLQSYPGVEIVIGGGTGSASSIEALQSSFPNVPIHRVDERDTSRHARARYCQENPAPGLRRLLPAGLRSPEEPYDDYVAILLAEEFLRTHKA
jgi:RNase H-fold protein (predicted Holliday junction resolvase)